MVDENPKQNDQDRVQAFLRLYSEYQHRIYGFIMSFVRDWNEADDIYQETTSVLWNKFDEFVPGTDFLSWSLKVAHLQVLSHLRKKKTRRKHFSPATLENLNEVAMAAGEDSEMSIEALRNCVKKLSEQSRQLLTLRYKEGSTVSRIALRFQLSVNTLYKQYQKIHVQLFRCIRRQLGWD